MGGTYRPDNIAILNVFEHAEAHKALYVQYGKKEDWLAWKALCGQINKKALTVQLEQLRREHISKGLKGHPVSTKTREKISKSNKGRPKSASHRAHLSQARMGKSPWNKGKSFSALSRQKMRMARLGKPWSAARRLAYKRTQTT